MSKKVKILIGSLVAVGVLTAAIVGVAVADVGDDDGCTGACCEQWAGARGHGFGRVLCEDVCELLGLSREEIRDQLADGKSLAQIADDQGVSEDALVETIVSGASEMLQSRVDDGALTQEQADVMLDRMEQVLRLVIHWEGIPASGGPGFWRGGGFHKGMGPGAMQGLAGTTRPSTDSEGWGSGHSLLRVAPQLPGNPWGIGPGRHDPEGSHYNWRAGGNPWRAGHGNSLAMSMC